MLEPRKFSENTYKLAIPLFENTIPAGFPSPADDYYEKVLDLHDHLIQHPSSTFYIRVESDAMTGAGIFPKDLLIVDKSLEPKNNDVILAILNGEFVLRRYVKRPGQTWLIPENHCYPKILIEKDFDFEVWGVVAHAIHHLI